MAEITMQIIVALVYIKLFLFWLWLWQLKEYHVGRFLAHFQEGQAFKKIISSLWRLKYPKFTSKTIVILLVGVSLALFIIAQGYYLFVFLLIILVPLFFQIPTLFWRNIYIEKARRKRMQFSNLLVIGITGSYGKTTTKEFLAHILSRKFKVLKTKEHQNSEVGVSNCILQELKPEHEIFVCEMGAYNRGGIKLLASIAKPRIGVLTGINQQHMATFGSQENIIKAKYELIESLPANGVAFFNAKNNYCVELYNKTGIKKVLYGQTASFRGEENILGAAAVAKELGMSDEEIFAAVKGIDTTFPGAKIQKGKDGFTIVEATYSANPDGVMAALEYLRKLPGRKIIVMPCLIELGPASKEVHRAIGKKIGEICDLAIITTRDRFDDIKEAASAEASASQRESKVIYIENAKEIADIIKRATSSGDMVFLEGRVPQALLSYLV
jgi:UDP-N-acetylmuramoyl-tripeptide--D-alanyl-D-alanine ligase